MSRGLGIVLATMILFSGVNVIEAQEFVFRARAVKASPETVVDVPILMDSDTAINGFQIDIRHSGTVAELIEIDFGSATLLAGGGNRPPFVLLIIESMGNPGGILGVPGFVLNPLEAQIPAGQDHELAIFRYMVRGSSGSEELTLTRAQNFVIIGMDSEFPQKLINGLITVESISVEFQRGDTNDDGTVDISDAVFLSKWLRGIGPKGACEDAGDVDDNGTVESMDTMFLLSALFLGGRRVAPPAITCGTDTTDPLGCARYLSCD